MPYIILVLLLVFGGGYYWHDRTVISLTHERDSARADAGKAVGEALRWKAVADSRQAAVLVSGDALQACQRREEQAMRDALEVESLLSRAVPAPRAPNNNHEVIDHATRSAVIERLNRPL